MRLCAREASGLENMSDVHTVRRRSASANGTTCRPKVGKRDTRIRSQDRVERHDGENVARNDGKQRISTSEVGNGQIQRQHLQPFTARQPYADQPADQAGEMQDVNVELWPERLASEEIDWSDLPTQDSYRKFLETLSWKRHGTMRLQIGLGQFGD